MRPTRTSRKSSQPSRQKAQPGNRTQPQSGPLRVARPSAARADRWLYGRHAVLVALANPVRHWRRLVVSPAHQDEAIGLAAAAQARHVSSDAPIEVVDRAAFSALLGEDAVHQGWALEVDPLAEIDLGDLLRTVEIESAVASGRQIIIVLDQVTDPHNVGAVLRSAAAFGARGVIVAEHGAPSVGGVLAKAASGALDVVPLIRAVNVARALDQLKEAGFWCCGLDETATEPLAAHDLGPRVVLVLGSEGGGLRRLVRERCDYLARLPTRPPLASLNVSNAAAVALYEVVREESQSS